MKIGDIVIAPEGVYENLTPFKEYKVIGFWDKTPFGVGFIIKDDNGFMAGFLELKYCSLNDQNWIIKSKTEAEYNELSKLIKLTRKQAERKEYLTKVLKK